MGLLRRTNLIALAQARFLASLTDRACRRPDWPSSAPECLDVDLVHARTLPRGNQRRLASTLSKLAVSALLVLTIGCHDTSEPALPLEHANGAVVGGPRLLVLPKGGWIAYEGGIAAEQSRRISFLVVDRRSESSDLTVTVRGPAVDRQDGPLRVRWNGERVEDAQLVEAGVVAIQIPRSQLTGGLDLLELVPPSQSSERAEISAVSWVSGDDTGVLESSNLSLLGALAQFLEYGVAGDGPALEGGVLAVGDHVVRIQAPGRSGTVRFAVRNLGGGPSTFIARVRDAGETQVLRRDQLAVGEIARFEATTSGNAELTLERLDAEPGSLTLWVQPRVSETRVRVPVVLLITLDTTRRGALGAYDARVESTPRLDRLAARATVYDHAVSTTSWTLPAHASIFTGRFPRDHRAGVTAAALPPSARTVAMEVGDRYRTVGVAGGPLVRHVFGVGRGFGNYRVPEANRIAGSEVADLAIQALRESANEPIFLFLNFFDPHFPYAIDPQSATGAAADAAALRLPMDSAGHRLVRGDVQVWLEAIEQRLKPTSSDITALRLAYAAGVAQMDHEIGRVLDELERSGRFEDSLIVAVADHGELLGERGLFSHAVLLEPELTAIPLIVKYPGQRSAERVSELVSQVDLFPTLLRAAGSRPPASSGITLTDLQSLATRAHVMMEEHESIVHPFYKGIKLGSNLVGYEGRLERMVRWSDGERCWSRVGAVWDNASACSDEARAPDFAAQLRAMNLKPPAHHGSEAGEIDAAERARLRAVGYL